MINLIHAASHPGIIFSTCPVAFLNTNIGSCHIQINSITLGLFLCILKNIDVIKFQLFNSCLRELFISKEISSILAFPASSWNFLLSCDIINPALIPCHVASQIKKIESFLPL